MRLGAVERESRGPEGLADIITYNAAISACRERGEPLALALLAEARRRAVRGQWTSD